MVACSVLSPESVFARESFVWSSLRCLSAFMFIVYEIVYMAQGGRAAFGSVFATREKLSRVGVDQELMRA